MFFNFIILGSSTAEQDPVKIKVARSNRARGAIDAFRYNKTMENDNFLEKEHLLVDCIENGWKLFVQELSALKGFDGINFRSEILGRLTKPRDFNNALAKVVAQKQKEHPGLSVVDARVAIMTENGIIFGVLKSRGIEDLPQGYVKTVRALNANLPWNKTGFNTITINQLIIDDLKESCDFIKSKLSK